MVLLAPVAARAAELPWTLVVDDGFGNADNFEAPSMLEFGDELFVGTYRSSIITTLPCQVWRGSARVFSDGLESGDTSRWSAAVP